MKICPKCQLRPSKRNDKPNGAPYCGPCWSEWANERARRNTDIIRQAKDVPCADCGQRYHWFVMDFDHVRGTKRKNVSRMTTMSESNIRAEIAKCDVVCSNCHRLRTLSRMAPRFLDL